MRIALATCRNLPDWEVDDRPLHEAFRRRGIEAVLEVWDDPAVGWAGYDACLIRTTWDYMERHGAYVAWAERVTTLTRLFNPVEIVRWNTHKSYLRDLETRGAPIAPTVWLSRGEAADLRSLMADRAWTRGFIKPAVGATARETMRFDASGPGLRDAQAHLDRTLQAEDMMLQPYLARVEREGELSGIFFDGALSHAVRKVPVPGDYRVQDDFGATDAPCTLDADAAALAEAIVGLVAPAPLYARVDLLRDDAGSLRLSELELVEPSLFFRHAPEAADRLVEALVRRVEG